MASFYFCLGFCLLLFTPSSLAGDSDVEVITDATSSVFKEGEWMIEFYAPWCPACQTFESTWDRFAEACKKKYPEVRVAKVDVTEQTILSGRFLIQRLPTIYHAKDNEFRLFDSDRSASSLERFIADEMWRDIDPSPWYTSPMGPISAVLGYSMLAGNELQRAYTYLTVEQSLPVWLVILIGVATVVTSGILIGLSVVFITLRFSPKVPVQAIQSPPPANFGSTGEGDEPDKKKSSSSDGADKASEEVDIDKSPPHSPKHNPDASPRPSKSADKQSPKPSVEASPGRETARKRKGKKVKASAD